MTCLLAFLIIQVIDFVTMSLAPDTSICTLLFVFFIYMFNFHKHVHRNVA
jgi:hypothetical protein